MPPEKQFPISQSTPVTPRAPPIVPGQVRTIDGKPFQPPPDGRNTANQIKPKLAKEGK